MALIEGLWLCDAGRQVCFIDAAQNLGGSWKVASCLGYDNIETGVHLIENRPNVNRWMRSVLQGRVLSQETMQNTGLWRGHHIPIAATRVLLHSLVAGKAVLRRRFDTASRVGLSARRAAQNLNTEFLYPTGGFSSLVAALTAQLRQKGAKFCMGSQVESVTPRATSIMLHGAGWNMEAARLLMSSRAHAHINANDAPEVAVSSTTINSIAVLIDGQARFDGYVEIFTDPLIKRCRNIGIFACPKVDPTQTILSVQLRKPMNLLKNCGTQVCYSLSVLGLLEQSARCLDEQPMPVVLHTMSARSAQQINQRFSPVLQVLESTDFADCLETRLQNYLRASPSE
ncbi:MAG: hypothetical protein COA47_12875 [Robiginitomaculum sp.]|nr:MAG: hypothetical protein COA47_12875 [Robiginitomaculum sp.]